MEERGTQETDARGNQPEVGLGVGRVPEKVLGHWTAGRNNRMSKRKYSS